MKSKILAAIFSLAAFSAAGAAERNAGTTSGLQGGAPDHGYTAVGLLVSVWRENGEPAFEICTGTLIGPQVVLTAAHCVMDHPISDFLMGDGAPVPGIVVEPFTDPATRDMVRIPVDKQAGFPGFKMGPDCPDPAADVGLVHLTRPVEDVLPATIDLSLPAIMQTCQGVGFGAHEEANGAITYEEKRSGDEAVEFIGPSGIGITYITAQPDHGDSGGLLFCDGTIRAVCSCANGVWPINKRVYYSRIDIAVEWMISTVDGWGSST